MNRTQLFLFVAAALAVAALVAGLQPGSVRPVAGPAPVPAPGLASPTVPLAAPAPSVGVRTPTLAAQSVQLTAALSSSRVLAGESTVYAKLDWVAGSVERKAARQPVNIAVAIDRSGSMTGSKMAQARDAARQLVDSLQSEDRLAIVAFDDRVETFHSQAMTPGNKALARAFIGAISERGETNISAALQASYQALRVHASDYRVSRVVLLSDGQPTQGVVDPAALVRLVEAERGSQISTSAFGIGLGFNALLMRDLAGRGGGTFAFIENGTNLGIAFARELADAAQLIARKVELRIRPMVGVSVEDVPGHAFTRDGADARVDAYDLAPSAGESMLVRLKVSAPRAGELALADVSLSYVDVQRDVPMTVTAMLKGSATTDERDVAAGANIAVMEMAKAVDLTTRVAQAQLAYNQGDSRRAFDIMDNVRAMFGTSADALAGSVDEVEGRWRQGGEAARRADIELTRKSMRNFGQNNSAAY